jgi:hypothetical protein
MRAIKRMGGSHLGEESTYTVYAFSRQQMQAYLCEGSASEDGYLVTYTLHLLDSHPHGGPRRMRVMRKVVFVNYCKSVRPFEPIRQEEEFQQTYQVDIHPRLLEAQFAAGC